MILYNSGQTALRLRALIGCGRYLDCAQRVRRTLLIGRQDKLSWAQPFSR